MPHFGYWCIKNKNTKQNYYLDNFMKSDKQLQGNKRM